MANPTRSPKSISDWNLRNIWAYNIKIVNQNTLEFFGVSDSELPPPRVHDEVLTVKYSEAAQHDDAYLLLSTKALGYCGDSPVVDFTAELFRVLGYVGRAEGRFTRTRVDLPLRVREHEMVVNVDVCIVDDNNQVVLLAQEDKTDDEEDLGDIPEVRLIAGAIAAFGINNNLGIRTLGSSQDDAPVEKVIAGITMEDEIPSFYKIPVTAGLVEAVSLGTFPQQETIVHTYTPRCQKDFGDLECRRVVLSCCEAFKKFL